MIKTEISTLPPIIQNRNNDYHLHLRRLYSLTSKMLEAIGSIIEKIFSEIRQQQYDLSQGLEFLNRARSKRPDSGTADFPPEALRWLKRLGQDGIDGFLGKLSVERYDQAILTMRGTIDDLKSQMDLNMILGRQFMADQNQTVEYNNSLAEKTNRTNLSIINMFRQ